MADIINNGQDVIVYKVYWTVWYPTLEIVEVVACYSAYQAYKLIEVIYKQIAIGVVADTYYYSSGK